MNAPGITDADDDYTPWRAAQFYIPLVIQAFSQSLTYPLVAAIISHGGNGVVDLAAFAQGQTVMFVIGAFGGGMITTGMVFGRYAEGFRNFKRLNLGITLALGVAQALLCIPPFDGFVFRTVLGLHAPMDAIARDVLFLCIPLQFFFFVRNVPLAALYTARASAAANWATLCRIVLTGLLVPVFVRLGWTGYRMGVLAMTVPVVLETVLAQIFAERYVQNLPQDTATPATFRSQLMFSIPLSFGGVLLALSGFMIGAFIARAAEPARMLPIHYITIGIVNPVSYAALRMQTVALSFPPRDKRDHRVFHFAWMSGCLLSVFPLIGQIPVVAHWYFGALQNLPDTDVPLAMRAMLLASVLPVIQSMRGHAEGVAAWRKRPNAILAGQAMNLAALVCSLFVGLSLRLPGYIIGVIAILIAVVATLVTIRMGLFWAEMESGFSKPPASIHGAEG